MTTVKVSQLNLDLVTKQALTAVANDIASQRAPTLASVADDLDLRTQLAAAIVDLALVRTKLNQAVADMTAMRAAVVGITAKLDADAGVTDTNYAATLNPAAQTSTGALAALTAAAPAAATQTVSSVAATIVA